MGEARAVAPHLAHPGVGLLARLRRGQLRGRERVGARGVQRFDVAIDASALDLGPRQRHAITQPVAGLRVVSGGVHRLHDAVAVPGALRPHLALGLEPESAEPGEEQLVDPLTEKRRGLVVQLQRVPVVVRSLRVLARLDQRVPDEDHVHPAIGAELVEGRDQLAPVLQGSDVALAISDIFDAADLRDRADMRLDERLQPVERVNHQSLEPVILPSKERDGVESLLPVPRLRKARDVEVRGAVLGAEEDGRGRVGAESRLADALGPVDEHAERGLDATAGDGAEGHAGPLLWSRGAGLVAIRRGHVGSGCVHAACSCGAD